MLYLLLCCLFKISSCVTCCGRKPNGCRLLCFGFAGTPTDTTTRADSGALLLSLQKTIATRFEHLHIIGCPSRALKSCRVSKQLILWQIQYSNAIPDFVSSNERVKDRWLPSTLRWVAGGVGAGGGRRDLLTRTKFHGLGVFNGLITGAPSVCWSEEFASCCNLLPASSILRSFQYLFFLYNLSLRLFSACSWEAGRRVNVITRPSDHRRK